MPTMIDIVTDLQSVRRIADALQTFELPVKLKDDLGKLYKEEFGLAVGRDRGGRVRGPTVLSCSRIGTLLTNFFQPIGRHDSMMWIGELTYIDGTERWTMRPSIRQAIDALGWFTEFSTDRNDGGDDRDEVRDYEVVFRDRVRRASGDKSAARKARLKKASVQPTRVALRTWIFVRNPDVVAEVLQRAEGKCEQCQAPAPFIRASDGTPYLEVHHRVPLIEHGEDSVTNAIAVCPNCHRNFHYGDSGTIRGADPK